MDDKQSFHSISMDDKYLTGLECHKASEKAREEGDFLKALKLSDKATITFQKEGNVLGLAEVQSARFITLRHLFEATGDKNYLILAKHSAQSSVEIMEATSSKDGLGIPLYNLGKCQETMGEYEEALASYKKALETLESSNNDSQKKDSVFAEIKTRIAASEYRKGDDSALDRFEQALIELKSAEEDDYTKNVWISGAHMHLAGAMIDKGEKDEAAKQIGFAKQIIDSDSRLTLRKKQLEKLSASL